MGDGQAVDLLWTYTPDDCFSESVPVNGTGYKAVIDGGQVRARVDAAVYDKDPKALQDEICRAVDAHLLKKAIATHTSPKLSGLRSEARVRADGTNSAVNVFAPSLEARTRGMGTVDIVTKDSAGNVVTDTAAERDKRQSDIAGLWAKHVLTDETAKSLRESWLRANGDPDHVLGRLYEVRDALSERFGSKGNAIRTLGIKDEWDTLGRLANDPSIRQARHGGGEAKAHTQRDATDAELAEARAATLSMIEKYLRHLP